MAALATIESKCRGGEKKGPHFWLVERIGRMWSVRFFARNTYPRLEYDWTVVTQALLPPNHTSNGGRYKRTGKKDIQFWGWCWYTKLLCK